MRPTSAVSKSGMTEPAVAVTGVTKVFPVPFQRRSVVAVRDLNLQAPPAKSTAARAKWLRQEHDVKNHPRSRLAHAWQNRNLRARQQSGRKSRGARFSAREPLLLQISDRRRDDTLLRKILRTAWRAIEEPRRRTAHACWPNKCARSPLGRLFQRHVATHRPRSSARPGTETRGPGRTDCRSRSGGRSGNQRPYSRSQTSRHYHPPFVASARAGTGGLRSRGHSRERSPRPRRRVAHLLAIQNQTDVVLENASPELLHEIKTLAAKSGARLIEQSRSRTSLERLFLDATQPSEEATGRNPDE
jgi:hypothetical protein